MMCLFHSDLGLDLDIYLSCHILLHLETFVENISPTGTSASLKWVRQLAKAFLVVGSEEKIFSQFFKIKNVLLFWKNHGSVIDDDAKVISTCAVFLRSNKKVAS